MSQDLVAKGIAISNLVPNTPSLDARPLVEAAAAYAQKNGYATIIANPGSYYFLSLHASGSPTHVLLSSTANLTIDFQHSDLYFKFSNITGFDCANCNSVTMQNFTVDYLQLPFTQLTVSSVDSVNRNITFQSINGYQLPSDFNANRSPSGETDALWMFVFRNGVPLPQAGRLATAPPFSGNTIRVTNDGLPWTQASVLAAIQPGDTIVLTDRGGPPAVEFTGGQNDTFRNVSVYASGQIGIYFGRTLNAIADRNQVIPRPGTGRLISTNADGIHTSFTLANSVFSNNIVKRTCDDALAMAASWIATVASVASGTSVPVSRYQTQPIPVGASVSFININTSEIVGTATVTAESPSPDAQTITNNETITLTLDQPISGLASGYGVINADPATHGSGSMITNNLVQEGVFARGIWFSGMANATATDNLVQRTSNVGILVQQLNNTTSLTGPSSGIKILNNIVDSAISYGAPSTNVMISAASINVIAPNAMNQQVKTTPFTNVAISGNRVTNSPRTAIRMENVSTGSVTGNTIQGYALAPSANVYLYPTCCETAAQYNADFTMPVVVQPAPYNNVINNSANSTMVAQVASGSNASGSPRLAPESIASAFGTNLATTTVSNKAATLPTSLGGVTVTLKDSAGVSSAAGLFFVSPNQVNYQVPAGMAPGNATVTIGTATGGVQIETVAPGILAANGGGQGVALATAALYSANGAMTPVSLFQCGTTGCTSVPMNLGGPTDQLAIILYGTGLRGLSSPQNATAQIAGMPAQILFLGAQSQFPGLDQVNLIVPRSLAGAGEVPIVLTVDGQTANVVTINIQ
jgi:uncharacterized protein (TIGR03437 family)